MGMCAVELTAPVRLAPMSAVKSDNIDIVDRRKKCACVCVCVCVCVCANHVYRNDSIVQTQMTLQF